jgi:signal transduction histidine kinase
MEVFSTLCTGDGSSTRAYGGSGLGLSISKQLVGIMGGSICGENNARGGATFTFTIPVKAGAKSDLS